MKKRILSLLLAGILLLGLLPQPAFAADKQEIRTAADFANMKSGVDYILMNDLEVTAPSKLTFRNEFDGNGYTITFKASFITIYY